MYTATGQSASSCVRTWNVITQGRYVSGVVHYTPQDNGSADTGMVPKVAGKVLSGASLGGVCVQLR